MTAPLIDWGVVDEPFTAPFFEQTANDAMQHPFNQIFARTTGLDALDVLGEEERTPPAGLIFHMSRCGSTLVAQMLARLPAAVVLSEPQPFDGLLRMLRALNADEEAATRRLRGLVRAFAPDDAERRLVVKLHAWHALELPLFARAFPGVPWIFMFREPRDVLRSQARNQGAELMPGAIDPSYAGLPDAGELAAGDYGARALAAFCDAALRAAGSAPSAFVDYAALPDAVLATVLPLFGFAGDAAQTALLHEAAGRDAKSAGTPFTPLAEELAAGTELEIDRQAARWLDAPYAELKRRAARAASAHSSARTRSGRC
jgi:hypothetical protein